MNELHTRKTTPIKTEHTKSTHSPEVKIRRITSQEIVFLADFLYEAIFIPERMARPGREILKIPEIANYIIDFGRENDHCLVAESEGSLVAAIWTRIFAQNAKGFGYVDERTPELSMSVLPGYRGRGIGANLLSSMIDRLKQLDYEQVSLSVDLENYAYSLYQKFGFITVAVTEGSATMLKRLR